MYNVLIFGAGRISSQYDEPQDTSVLTDAHAIGHPFCGCAHEEEPLKVFRRLLLITKGIRKWGCFIPDNVRPARLSYGLHTRYLGDVCGRPAKEGLVTDTPLLKEMISKSRWLYKAFFTICITDN